MFKALERNVDVNSFGICLFQTETRNFVVPLKMNKGRRALFLPYAEYVLSEMFVEK